jgi:hypothetical protein
MSKVTALELELSTHELPTPLEGLSIYALVRLLTASPVPPPYVLITRRLSPHVLKGQSSSHLNPKSRYTNRSLTIDSLINWEFSGWGNKQHYELTEEEIRNGHQKIAESMGRKNMSSWLAMAISGNDLFSSVFYSFPAVTAVSGILYV